MVNHVAEKELEMNSIFTPSALNSKKPLKTSMNLKRRPVLQEASRLMLKVIAQWGYDPGRKNKKMNYRAIIDMYKTALAARRIFLKKRRYSCNALSLFHRF
ncbi:hypothetical protein SAMN06265348_10114 [Pedobacter westerhofensis]|uniref:Uncharacterized protein n=1 Tax=Pedobacter westerhofensis TaxID=425512 RepID=A0A521AAS3_9SPHI|nr:hypothetical protein SAMN06265348_10114 [Pedobacter westerhofensis]